MPLMRRWLLTRRITSARIRVRREEREEHGLVSGSDRTPVAPTNERALLQHFRRIDEPCTKMGV